MNKLKQEKGGATLFVLIAMLFFSMFLIGMYVATANLESTQAEEIDVIKGIYEQGINNIDDLYETIDSTNNVI